MSNISQSGFTIVAWTFAGAAAALTTGRYVIRIRLARGLQWDDLFHGLAFITLICYLVVYTLAIPAALKASNHVESKDPDPSSAEVDQLLRQKFATMMLMWITFYLIKLSFLMFYRQLFGVSKPFRKAWWAVVALTLFTFLVGFLSMFWMCGVPVDLFVANKCLAPRGIQSITQVLQIGCALNVISDVSIMALPLRMLWGLQLPINKKIGLSSIFLLTTIDIIFDIVRTVFNTRQGAVAPYTVFDAMVVSIAVMVSALPTYHGLFVSSRKRDTKPYTNLEMNK